MKKILDFKVLIPNCITMISICSGLSAIRFAVEGNFKISILAILMAALLDGIDGRVARALRATSKFGAEFDSLADVINFGVVPALVLYVWDLKNLGNFGWLACLIFVIAMALRLARFNVGNIEETFFTHHTDSPSRDIPQKEIQPKAYFIGVPAPVGAIIVLLPIYLSLNGLFVPKIFHYIEALYVMIVAGYTICTLKTFSIKAIRFNFQNIIPVMFSIACIAALLFSFTWLGLAMICLCYLFYLFFISFKALLRYNKQKP